MRRVSDVTYKLVSETLFVIERNFPPDMSDEPMNQTSNKSSYMR